MKRRALIVVLAACGGGGTSEHNAPADASPDAFVRRGTGAFAPQMLVEVGNWPSFVRAADLDRDGHIDLLVYTSRGLELLRGRGDGTFADPTIQVISRHGSTQFKDVDADGIQDLVISNGEQATLSVLRGVGDGTFAPAEDYPVGSPPPTTATYGAALAVVDVDGDHHLDVVVLRSYDHQLGFLRNNGDGTLAPPIFTQLTGGGDVLAADLLGDGTSELVAVESSGRAWSYDGSGHFTGGPEFSAGGYPAVTSADIDGDGAEDLIFGVPGSALDVAATHASIKLSNRDLTFRPGPLDQPACMWSPHAVAVGQLDADDRLDIVYADETHENAAVILNHPDGSLSCDTYPIGRHALGIAIADFNEDGAADLAAANFEADRPGEHASFDPGHTVSVLLGIP